MLQEYEFFEEFLASYRDIQYQFSNKKSANTYLNIHRCFVIYRQKYVSLKTVDNLIDS